MIRITNLQIKNYRGVKDLSADVSGAGAIAKGRNGSGKTSVLGAITAALAAVDIKADAITLGAKSAEILVDLDAHGKALHVRRRISEKDSSLVVTNDDGDKKAAPTTALADLLGTSPIDVVELVLEKDAKKRKERIMKALPVKVTVEQLRRWVPTISPTYDVSGHGLEVLARVRSKAYDQRTEANRIAKETSAEASRLATIAAEARQKLPAGAVGSAAEERGQAVETMRRELDALHARKDASARAAERMSGLQKQIEKHRRDAAFNRAVKGPPRVELDAAERSLVDSKKLVDELEASLAAAREDHAKKWADLESLKASASAAARCAANAEESESAAAELERTIGEAVETISDEDIATATARHKSALAAYDTATQAKRAEEQEAIAREAKGRAAAAQADADRLDAMVAALTKDAPAAILAETPGAAAGLELDGDEVRIGGVSLDKLCGAEKMAFAAEIAKALSPQAGFIIADGLERLDEDQLEQFVAAATAGGRQLFGSRVAQGELQLVHLAPAPAVAAE